MSQPNVFITCKESRIESNRSFYGCFHLGPFDSGESLTVANALRRTLLTECLGYSIVSVTIDNVTHEYSTLPGMRESVLDLILNLKEVVFKKQNNVYSLYKKKSTIYDQIGTSYFKPVSGFLKVKGPGVIRAKDLKLPPFVECVDPEQYIATLAEDGVLSLKFIIMEGKGYLLQNKLSSATRRDLLDEKNPSVSFIDYNLVKNRQNFLKEIKKTVSNNKNNISFFEDKKIRSRSSNNMNSFENEEKTTSFTGKEVDNNKYLTLDAIFNPVTKVSYIIEDFNNKIVDDLNQKVNFVDDISTLIESSNYLKNNLPFLIDEIGIVSDNKETENNSLGMEKTSLLLTNTQTEISKLVDTYSTSEIQKLSSTLHPLKKQSPLHNIVLEIWTNGSLHPRDALYFAFDKLASAFLKMKKTQSYKSIYLNESSFNLAAQNSLINNNLSLISDISENKKSDSLAQRSSSLSLSRDKEGALRSPSFSESNIKTRVFEKRSSEGLHDTSSYGEQYKQQLSKAQLKLFLKKRSEDFNSSSIGKITGCIDNINFINQKEKGIELLNISLRPYTLLKRSNIHTIFELSQLTINDLNTICGFNQKYITNILDSLYF